MPEEIKERLSKTEYDKVGEMLLELIAECPYTPSDLKGKAGGILYDEIGDSKGVFILTDGGRREKIYFWYDNSSSQYENFIPECSKNKPTKN